MTEPSEFFRAYFIQTRQDIDTEKRERDQMLNFAIATLGAIGFAVVQSETAQQFLQTPFSFLFEIAVLAVLTSLFYIRRKKLQQISDRWYVLYRLAAGFFGKQRADEMVEGVIVRCLPTPRYFLKDYVLNIALSSPIYVMIAITTAATVALYGWIYLPWGPLVFLCHIWLSHWMLWRGFANPLPAETATVAEVEEE
jgi:hypothetical protein